MTIQKWWKKTLNSESLDFSEKACVDLLGKKSYDSLVQTFKNVNKKCEIHGQSYKSLLLKFNTSSQPWMNEMRAARSRTLKDIDFMKINLMDDIESNDENKDNWSDDDY